MRIQLEEKVKETLFGLVELSRQLKLNNFSFQVNHLIGIDILEYATFWRILVRESNRMDIYMIDKSNPTQLQYYYSKCY